MPHTGILLAGVAKSFGDHEVLSGLDLEILPGRLCALVGPNGAGKSTLLRILATTLLPDAGTVTVAGQDVVAQSDRVRRAIGVCFAEERSWYPQISGRRNLEFFAALHGMRRPEASRRVSAVLADVGLAEPADQPFATYSTGMRLRVALGRALLHEPPVLLLDEPTRSLDPSSAHGFVDRLLESARGAGRAVLMISHDVREAARADMVAILREGRIAEVLPGGVNPMVLARTIGA